MLFDLLWAAAGLALLVVAGDALVRGAVNLALRLGIPALIVGLTVVAFGTSAPELLVSIQAALADQDGIALGNVVGSNIANILLVLGLPALISAIRSSHLELRRDYLTMIGATLLFLAVAWDGFLSRLDGLVLLAGLALMLWDNVRSARRHRAAAAAAADDDDLEGADAGMPGWKIAGFLVAGLIGLPIGASLLVDASVNIARAFGVSETVIGLTLVAVGTSLPELATSIVAALRGKTDVALGNVIGSNVFNLLAILGIASLVDTLSVPAELLSYDVWVMLGVSLLLVPFVFMRLDITRIVGVGLTAIYAAYAASLVM